MLLIFIMVFSACVEVSGGWCMWTGGANLPGSFLGLPGLLACQYNIASIPPGRANCYMLMWQCGQLLFQIFLYCIV